MVIGKLYEYLLLIYRKTPLSYRSVDFTEVQIAPEKPKLGFMALSVTETPHTSDGLAPFGFNQLKCTIFDFFSVTVLL